MSEASRAPESSVLRLSRYHCFVGELLASGDVRHLTSRSIAEQLGVSDEAVRRDLSYVDIEGRPGAGYDAGQLYEALEKFLGISSCHPFVAIGSSQMLESLSVIFPAGSFGLSPVAYYSERAEDAGTTVHGLEVRPLSEIPQIDPCLGATVCVVACDPAAVPEALDLLDAAGIHAVLMLTTVLRPVHPEGMDVTYFRIPCALKALASSAPQPAPCCVVSDCVAGRGCSSVPQDAEDA